MSIQTIKSGVRVHDKSLNFVTGNIFPTEDWLIIEPLPPRLSQTIEANWNGEVVRGKVIAAGPGKYPNLHTRGFKPGKDGKSEQFRTVKKSKVFVPTEVKPGEIVNVGGMDIGGYLWKHVMVDGKDCVWVMEADVCFIEDPT
jgi:hypothetical protein